MSKSSSFNKNMQKLFIFIGSYAIKTKREIKYKIKNNKTKKSKKTINDTITTKILENNQNNIKKPKIWLFLIILFSIFILILNTEIGLEIILIIFLLNFIKKKLPKIKEDKKRSEILKVLPFALRELSTQLKAGIGIFDAMQTIADSEYEPLSTEFQITLKDIKYGTNYIEAFDKLSKRVNSKVLDNVINQITRTLINGGNLSNTLNTIANDNSRNIKIKYKEYSEKLNSIMLLYMFIAVLIPVILFIMIVAATTVMGSIINPEVLLILYLFFFPMIIIIMIIFIKNLEPTV